MHHQKFFSLLLFSINDIGRNENNQHRKTTQELQWLFRAAIFFSFWKKNDKFFPAKPPVNFCVQQHLLVFL